MEHSISSLAFKGSVIEAISEAKRQKKLFVVYISGDNAESSNLETSMLTELSVAEALSKYCILVHISEGSVDAAHLSAIYPQKSSPCITVIAYNGLQLWQQEGFITAEVLASSLEKAWLNLHIQETTASVLTAALAAKKTEQLTHGGTDSNSPGQGTSSSSDVPSPSMDKHVHSSEAKTTSNSEAVDENKYSKHALKEVNSKVDDEVFHAPDNESGSGHAEQSSPSKVHESLDPVKTNPDSIADRHKSVSEEVGYPVPKENLIDPRSVAKEATSQVIANEANEAVHTEIFKDEKDDGLDLSANKSNDVHLNIRLPDFTSLQEKFSLTSTLRVVKDCVDEKQESSIGSYDLAIPYPRKVFSNEDLGKTLSELGLFNRQALIVVPHSQAIGQRKEGNRTPATNVIGSSSGSSEGYLSFVKRIISYVNPLSYLGGGTSSPSTVHESQSSTWQYSPNPTLQNNLRGTGRSNLAQPNQSTPATSGNSRRPTSSRFGSNIHTLKHDEDDSHQTSDRNTFWNGNSTQYGGDNDGK